MKITKILFVFGILLTISSAFAQRGSYRSDDLLRLGDRTSNGESVCVVKGQLVLRAVSDPLMVSRGEYLCQAALAGDAREHETVTAILNGNTDVINCLVCVALIR